jgi:hypothetical protein
VSDEYENAQIVIPRQIAAEVRAWCEDQPNDACRQMALAYPPGSYIIKADDSRMHVVGYLEDGRLLVSPISPMDDYERALASENMRPVMVQPRSAH